MVLYGVYPHAIKSTQQRKIFPKLRVFSMSCDYEIDEQSKYPFLENYKFKVSNSNIK